jgi:hypothetical protein
VLEEGGEALRIMAASLDLKPRRAGLADDPEDDLAKLRGGKSLRKGTRLRGRVRHFPR